MRNKLKNIAFLCFLGFVLGTGVAWYQVKQEIDRGRGYANIEPASGGTQAQEDVFGGTFSLIDHNGNAVTDSHYANSYKLVFFGFTHCPDICPAGLQKMSAALKAVGTDAEKISPLFITIDPKRDTPEVMKEYVEMFDERIIGLTGDEDAVKNTVKNYKVYAARVNDEAMADGYTMNHSSYTFFIGPNGELIEIFGGDDTATDMAAAIEKAI